MTKTRMKQRCDMKDTIIVHDARDLSILGDTTVDLTVTSPPYWNAIDYDVHAQSGGEHNYRQRRYARGYSSYSSYMLWLREVFCAQLLPRTSPGGFCAVVLGTVLLDGRHYPLPFDFTSIMVKGGWEFWQDIIWHKVTAGVKRAGGFIQRPYPGYYYPNIMTEYILVFRRAGERLRSAADISASAVTVDDLFKHDTANNVWHIPPVPPRTLNHPCPFPEEIPWRLISLYSRRGDLVFDPFAGSGQTLKVARWLGRHYLGMDIEPRYVEYARTRLDERLRLRSEQIICRYDKVSLGEAVDCDGQMMLFDEGDERKP